MREDQIVARELELLQLSPYESPKLKVGQGVLSIEEEWMESNNEPTGTVSFCRVEYRVRDEKGGPINTTGLVMHRQTINMILRLPDPMKRLKAAVLEHLFDPTT